MGTTAGPLEIGESARIIIAMPRTLSFITANYVARALNYPGGATHDWADHEEATIEKASAQTFDAVLRDIAAAGFDRVDVWMAHCHWRHHDREDYLEVVKGLLSQYDFTINGYAGGLRPEKPEDLEEAFRFMKQLGAPIWAGGMWDADPAEMAPLVNNICERLGVRWAYENHAETSVEQILENIDGGKHKNVGVALDTGWCGTHGIDAVEAAERLGERLMLVHLKDVKQKGQHESCTLGDGVVGVEAFVRHLVDTKWPGTITIEHEPFDRDPMREVLESVQRVRKWGW